MDNKLLLGMVVIAALIIFNVGSPGLGSIINPASQSTYTESSDSSVVSATTQIEPATSGGGGGGSGAVYVAPVQPQQPAQTTTTTTSTTSSTGYNPWLVVLAIAVIIYFLSHKKTTVVHKRAR